MKNNTRNVPDVAFLFIYALLIFFFLLLSRTFFSGFHLIDDQTYIVLNTKYGNQHFIPACIDEIKDDLYLRFRPLAIIYYVAIAKFIYPSFTGIAVILALQGIFCCYFFFRFARLMGLNKFLSFVFPLFIICGNQGVILWRNCMSETLCMLLISLASYFLARSLVRKKSGLDQKLFYIFLFLSTLVKESFIILVPAMLFLKIWLESIYFKISFSASFKRNIWPPLIFILVMITEIGIIYHYKAISEHFIDYVAIDEQTFKPANIGISLFRLLITKGYFIAIAPVLLLIFLWRKQFVHWKQDVQNFFLPLIVLFLLIIIPQIILYSKSLIFERYLLPGTLGGAFLIIFIQQYINRNKAQLKLIDIIFLPACLLLLMVQIGLMTKGAVLYAKDGYQVKDVLGTIEKITSTNDNILLVAQPKGQSEPAQSVRTYLNAAIGGWKKNVFIEPIVDSQTNMTKTELSDLNNFLAITKDKRYDNIPDKKNIRCILFFQNMKERFLPAHPEIDTMEYEASTIGKFIIYIKKNQNLQNFRIYRIEVIVLAFVIQHYIS